MSEPTRCERCGLTIAAGADPWPVALDVEAYFHAECWRAWREGEPEQLLREPGTPPPDLVPMRCVACGGPYRGVALHSLDAQERLVRRDPMPCCSRGCWIQYCEELAAAEARSWRTGQADKMLSHVSSGERDQ